MGFFKKAQDLIKEQKRRRVLRINQKERKAEANYSKALKLADKRNVLLDKKRQTAELRRATFRLNHPRLIATGTAIKRKADKLVDAEAKAFPSQVKAFKKFISSQQRKARRRTSKKDEFFGF